MEVPRPVRTKAVLRQTVQKILVAFEFLKQDCDPGSSLWHFIPKCVQISFGIVMNKQA